MTDTAQTIDVPERVATGRALINGAAAYYRPRCDSYRDVVGRAMLGTEDLHTFHSTLKMMLSRSDHAMELAPLCEVGDQLTAAEWAVVTDAEDPNISPYSVTVEQTPETGRAIIRSTHPTDPVSAEVTADDLAEVLARFGHQVERVHADWNGAEVTVIVR